MAGCLLSERIGVSVRAGEGAPGPPARGGGGRVGVIGWWVGQGSDGGTGRRESGAAVAAFAGGDVNDLDRRSRGLPPRVPAAATVTMASPLPLRGRREIFRSIPRVALARGLARFTRGYSPASLRDALEGSGGGAGREWGRGGAGVGAEGRMGVGRRADGAGRGSARAGCWVRLRGEVSSWPSLAFAGPGGAAGCSHG